MREVGCLGFLVCSCWEPGGVLVWFDPDTMGEGLSFRIAWRMDIFLLSLFLNMVGRVVGRSVGLVVFVLDTREQAAQT